MDTLSFTDTRGTTWTVYELPANQIVFDERVVDDSPAHLVFESRAGERTTLKRLRDYPGDWAQLGDADLEELCERATGPSAHGDVDGDELRRHLRDVST